MIGLGKAGADSGGIHANAIAELATVLTFYGGYGKRATLHERVGRT
jgi:hypothetical protein